MFLRAQLQKNSPAPKPAFGRKPAQEYSSSEQQQTNVPGFSYSVAGVRTFAHGESELSSGAPWRPLPFPLQTKLTVGAVNDPLEQEADRVADQVMRMPLAGASSASLAQIPSQGSVRKTSDEALPLRSECHSGSGFDAPAIVHEVLRSPGQPLDAATRAIMEPRFSHDFSNVRVHTDDTAAKSAEAVSARAYAVGNHLTFGFGQFSPATDPGRRLLSHELAHVIQQKSSSTLRRQQANPPTPGFSVNQGDYLKLVTQAIQSISGNLVQANTLAPVIQPVLSSLVGQAIWRDDKGKESGGKAVAVPLPGTPKVLLQLRLVLDDQLDPKLTGEFEHQDRDKTHGTMSIMIRKASDISTLKNVLFHEASHVLAWAMENWGATRFAGQDRRSVRALNLSLHSREIASIRNQLDALATSVNGRRPAGHAKITSADLDYVAKWLLDEAEVRAETKVFELYSDTQTFVAQRGPKIFVDTSKLIGIDSAMIDNYLFDFSKRFLPSDRAGLTAADKQILDLLSKMLAGIADLQVKRQFNITPYTIGTGMPRADVNIPLSPLTPPTFRPLPMP